MSKDQKSAETLRIAAFRESLAFEYADYLLMRLDLLTAWKKKSELQLLLNNEKQPDDPIDHVIELRSLWSAAIVGFFRCFKPAKGKTKAVDPHIFAGVTDGTTTAGEAFERMKKYRNKYIVHDESVLQQCNVGLIFSQEKGTCVGIAEIMAVNIPQKQDVAILRSLVTLTGRHVDEAIAKKKEECVNAGRRLGIGWASKQPELSLTIASENQIWRSRAGWQS